MGRDVLVRRRAESPRNTPGPSGACMKGACPHHRRHVGSRGVRPGREVFRAVVRRGRELKQVVAPVTTAIDARIGISHLRDPLSSWQVRRTGPF